MLRQTACALLLSAGLSAVLSVPASYAADAAKPAQPAPANPAAHVPKPSFDCATAKSKINLLICSDVDLAALDLREATMLKRAKAKAVTPDAVDAEQDVWLSERNGCGSVACLSRAYNRRIQQLRAWTD
jgi:uncharacterized protein